MHRSALVSLAAVAVTTAGANAAFSSFVIRNATVGGASPIIQPNNDYVPGATEFIIESGGQKAGWGTNDYSGTALGDITNLSIDRLDDSTRYPANTGGRYAPYFNIWITDGAGNYAVVANEPSNGSFQVFRTLGANGQFSYSFSIADIANEPAKIFETPGAAGGTSWVHALTGQSVASLKFSHLMGLAIEAPSAAYIANPVNAVSGGAPRQLGTSVAYGINWVFGDTLANYVSGMDGFIVANPSVLPAPGAAALLGLGGLCAARRRRAR